MKSSLHRAFSWLTGRVIVDDAVHALEAPLLLFVSDTPSMVYPELKRLLALLKPKYLVHTGDLADELKLQLYPRLRSVYQQAMIRLLRLVNHSEVVEIYFALGNHDLADVVHRYGGRVKVIESQACVCLEDFRVSMSHYAHLAKQGCDQGEAQFVLYGHDLTHPTQVLEGVRYLNGIQGIYVISLKSGLFVALEYPSGTDSARLKRYKIGI